jgi:hypothetical protein
MKLMDASCKLNPSTIETEAQTMKEILKANLFGLIGVAALVS